MVGSNGTMIAIRLVRSKLRKREDHHSSTDAVHPEATVVQTATSLVTTTTTTTTTNLEDDRCPRSPQISTDIGNGICNEAYATTTVTPTTNPVEPFAWQFPPPYPPPHMPPYTLYNDQDTLVHALPSHRPGFAKGFRKNLGGRWRRFVKRKNESDTCAIPPELKDQLKTIYVY